MKILITGGAGFIGSHLTLELLNKGHHVTVVDNLITGSRQNLQGFLGHRNFKFFLTAVDSPRFLKIFARPRAGVFNQIYHLACPTGVPNIQKLGEEMLRACSVGTWNVLRLAHKMHAKFLLASSSEIYGQPQVFPQNERYCGQVDPLGPRANYEEGKRFAETLTKWFVTYYGLDAKIVRLFNVYGPGMTRADQRVVPRLVCQALSNQPLLVHGSGRQRRTFCYITDVVRGLRLVMAQGLAGEAYNLGSNTEISIKHLAQIILRLTGSTGRIQFTARPPADHMSRLPDLRKIRALGWQPKVPLKLGLKLTIKDFQQRF